MTTTEKMEGKTDKPAKIFINAFKFRIFEGKINKFSLNQLNIQ